MVFHESKRRRIDDPLDAAAEPRAPLADDDRERLLSCLDRCLDSLDTDDRTLVLRYYGDDAAGRTIDARRDLARSLSISPTALRIRAFRIRERLEACVRTCLEESW